MAPKPRMTGEASPIVPLQGGQDQDAAHTRPEKADEGH
jgi:hypothetical protein